MKIKPLHKFITTTFVVVFTIFSALAQENIQENILITPGTTFKVQSETFLQAEGNTTVQSDGLLDIKGNATISGTVSSTDADGIIVRSTAIDEDGSFIFGAGTPNATIQRYVPLQDGGWGNYHQIGVPLMNGTTTSNFYFNGNPDTWLIRYNTIDDTYTFIYDLNETLHFGEGFMMMVDDAPATVSFEGAITAADFALTGSSTPLSLNTTGNGFNLVANPYSSALEFDNTWTYSNMEGSIWILDQTGGQSNYRSRTAAGAGTLTGGIIPMGQSFFVRVTGATPNLVIPANKRLHHGQAFYKSSQGIDSSYEYYMKLRVNEHQSWDEIMVSFGEHATEGFDNGFDCSKMMGDEKSPQLYLSESGVENLLSINHLPALTENRQRIVDMGFIPGQDGEQHFRASFTGMDNHRVILEDLKADVLHNLTDNPVYSFVSNKTDAPARFKIHFYDVTSLEDIAQQANTISVYSYNKQVYVQPSAQNTETITVQIFDIMGKQIYSAQLPASSLSRINLSHVPNSVVVVRLFAGSVMETTKVILQK